MKQITLCIILLALISCGEKTAKNSKYSEYIAELDRLQTKIDSIYTKFNKIEIDSLIAIRNHSDAKYKKVKNTYQMDSINPDYEKLMLTVRGQMVKKLKGVESHYTSIKNEYDYSKKQVADLRLNLIHEKLEDEDALVFYKEEQNAQIVLNGELVGFVESMNDVFQKYPILNAQMDSIINENEK